MMSRAEKCFTSREIVDNLFNPPEHLVCFSVPIRCQTNMSFLVSVSDLKHAQDITGDDNGKYSRPSSHKVKMEVEISGKVETIGVRRRYYTHEGTPTFKRMIYSLEDKTGKALPYFMLQYFFSDGLQKNLVYTKHGNSKCEEPFMPRNKSVGTTLQERSKFAAPSKVTAELLRHEGGVENIESLAQTPRNVRMAYYAKTKQTSPHRSRSGLNKKTDFNDMFRLAGKGEFVKSFELAGEHPRAYCATQQQIKDLISNCTGEDASISQLDPTFNVGDFYITTTCYRNKRFVKKSDNKNILMPGPYFLHARRETEDYEYFSQHLSSDLNGKTISFAGTDGEKALIQGLRRGRSFTDTVWLQCMLHAKENCERQLKKLNCTDKEIRKILTSIYGKEDAGVRYAGLVDLEGEEEFETELESLVQQWDQTFGSWFVKHKKGECLTMLASVRRAAGLGQIPKQFTTNDAEAENSLVKREMDWKKKTWGDACNHLHLKVISFYEELARAVFSEGKYRVADDS